MRNSVPPSVLPLPLLICLFAFLPLNGRATEFFVATGGSEKGDGSRAQPWSLAMALNQPATVKPGDTIWIQEGTYRGGFTCKLRGTKAEPITVRGVAGRVIIDTKPRDAKDSGVFDVNGEWTVFRDLEFTCSLLRRVSEEKTSWPTDVVRGSISARGSNLSFINLIVHDMAQGIGLWGNQESGEGGEIYGCLIYNHGWNGPDRGHGHGIYAQNALGTKRICDNIIFNQFGYGLHAYGSEKALLKGFHIEGNVLFNNGALVAPGRQDTDLAVGGGTPIDGLVLTDNCTYGGGIRLGHGLHVTNRNMVVQDNFFVGSGRFTGIAQIRFTRNTLMAAGTVFNWEQPTAQVSKDIEWNNNTYQRTKNEWAAINVATSGKTQAKSFADWQQFSSADSKSTYKEAPAGGSHVMVRANRYQPGRGHIVVYNWDRFPTIDVNLSVVLKKGQHFRIVSCQNFFGPAVLTGTYEGKPIQLPMRPTKPAQPVGMPDYSLPVTEPEFGAYVILATD
jgi:hypothetical protein